MINNVVLVGRLTADPELKTTNSNLSVTSFSVAVDRSFAKAGTDRQTDFINCVAWRSTAEFICKYFSKGRLIGLEGSIQTRKYTDRDGNNRTAFEVVVSQAHFVESKNAGGGYSDQGQSQGQGAAPGPVFDTAGLNDFSEIPDDDEELPF